MTAKAGEACSSLLGTVWPGSSLPTKPPSEATGPDSTAPATTCQSLVPKSGSVLAKLTGRFWWTLYSCCMLQLRVVLCSLVRNPGLTGAAILALALGIGANTALFTVIKSLALHPYPLPYGDRLVAVLEREPKDAWFRVAPADYFDLTRLTTSFAAV